jgi:hypothetical protein
VSAALSSPHMRVIDVSRLNKPPRLTPRQIRIFFWLLAIALGAAQAWATRFTMNPDGISYLDMGDAYWRGDWHVAINAYWSPLYSWILGFFLKLLRPSPYWEYPVAHLVNFLIYVAALGCFDFFLRNFIRSRRVSDQIASLESNVSLPEWAWLVLGYTLFISTSLRMITVKVVNPDMCLAGFVYLAFGFIPRISEGKVTHRTFVLLGVVLGFAYLTKSVMFPLAFVFLGVTALSYPSFSRGAKLAGGSALVVLAIAGPYVLALSAQKGRLTFGDSGKLTYAACINGVDPWYPGDGGRLVCQGTGFVEEADSWSPNREMLRHPAKMIFDEPPAYQFAGPVRGTYPFWYDPSYWQEGIAAHFNLQGEVQALKGSLVLYAWLVLSPFNQLNLTVGLLALLLLSPRPSACIRRQIQVWPLFTPALVGMAAYSIVHTEYRYVAAFVSILWIAAFSGVRLQASRESKWIIAGVVITIAVVSSVLAMVATTSIDRAAAKTGPIYWRAARALNEIGIHRADRIAIIADQPWGAGGRGASVARLAGVQIIAQINQPASFWNSSPATQAALLEAIRKTGASAVLAWVDPPLTSSEERWHALAAPGCYAYVYPSR